MPALKSKTPSKTPTPKTGNPPAASQSTTSSAGPQSPSPKPSPKVAGPSPLPPPKNKGGRPAGSKNKPKTSEETPLRELPKDPAELKKAVDSCRFAAQLVVSMGADRVLKGLGLSGLDELERDTGEEAWARYIYQHWGDIPPGVAILIWTGGVIAPRIPEAMEKYFPKDPKKVAAAAAAAEQKKREAELAAETRVEKEINPPPAKPAPAPAPKETPVEVLEFKKPG